MESIQLDRDEHSDFCWCPLADAIDMVWSWTNCEALEALRETYVALMGLYLAPSVISDL